MAGQNGRRLRLDALIRVSQLGDRDAKDLRSPDQQRDIINGWIASNGAEIVHEHMNVGLSGKTLDRPDIHGVLERIRTKQTDGLIVAYASRLSRARVDEAEAFKNAVLEAGGRMIVCDLGGEYADTAVGEFTFTILVAAARLQWRQAKDRYDGSRRDAIKAGKSISCPFGYRRKDPTKRANGRGIVNSRLVPDEQTAHLIPELFQRKADGHTWLQLSRWLDEVAPKPNGKVWSHQTVSGMIRSRTYLGEVRHGDYFKADAHEPLVSASVWRRAQNEPGHRTPRGTYLLTGMLRCAGCGRSMRGDSMGARKYGVYQCDNRTCPSKSTISVKRLDNEIIKQLFDWWAESLNRFDNGDAKLSEAISEVNRLTQQVRSLASVIPTHPEAIKAHQEALSALESQLHDAEDHRDRLQTGMPIDWLSCLESSNWHDLSLADQRANLLKVIDHIIIKRATGQGPASITADRIEIQWRWAEYRAKFRKQLDEALAQPGDGNHHRELADACEVCNP